MSLLNILFVIFIFSLHVCGNAAFLKSTDNVPIFSKRNYVFNVSEEQPRSTIVGRVRATGCTQNGVGQIIYDIRTHNVPFDIDNNGSILTTGILDREMYPTYQLRVEAHCPLYKISAISYVLINLEDINDNSPVFTRASYHANIDADTPDGTAVLQVMAVDGDVGLNSQISYSMISDHHSEPPFIINQNGTIILRTSIIRSDISSYSFGVLARDGGIPSLSSTAQVNISINIPAVVDRSSYYFQVTELLPINTMIGQVNSSSVTGTKSFAIIGTSDFIIDTNGTIFTAAWLDREKRSSYSFVVEVTDNRHLTTNASVEVKVLDVNDNAPVFPYKSVAFTLQPTIKSGDVLGCVVANDLDTGLNALLSYHLQPASNVVSIDSYIGTLTFIGDFLQLSQNGTSHKVVVVASDGGTPFLSSSVAVYLLI